MAAGLTRNFPLSATVGRGIAETWNFGKELGMTMRGFIEIAGGFSYAPHRVGLSLANRCGKTVYFQPGDDTAEILAQIEALEEIPEGKRGTIADMVFGEYFL